jgi:carboxymuconolactone decarboxylase family protein
MTRGRPTAPGSADDAAGRAARQAPYGELAGRAGTLPAAAEAYRRWGCALVDELPARTLSAIGLTVAALTDSPAQRDTHEHHARRLGMTDDEIVALQRKRGGMCPTLTEEEVAAATLARALLEDYGRGAGPALLRLTRLLGEPLATGCLLAVLHQAAAGAMSNTWELTAVAAAIDGHG